MTNLFPAQNEAQYLDSLTKEQRRRFDRLLTEGVMEERTDLVCADCGAPMKLRLGKYGRFYGCTKYPETGCRGAVSAEDNGTPKGPPVDWATRKARKQLAVRLKEVGLYELERFEEESPPPWGRRWRIRTFCEILGIKGDLITGVVELTREQCEKALEALDIIGDPDRRTRWDLLQLECLLPDE